MFITKDDFTIKPASFDLSDGHNIVRIICGAFMGSPQPRKAS